MTDLRKAAEMALDALHNIDQSNNYDAIEALRQALAQPEQYDQTALELCDVCGWKAIIPDEGCLVCARKNQTPVAWGEFKGDKLHDLFCTKYDADNIKKFRKDESVVKPLYTAPPKREWVGLTMQEYVEIENNVAAHYAPNNVPRSVRVFAQVLWETIEAKLKEKNT